MGNEKRTSVVRMSRQNALGNTVVQRRWTDLALSCYMRGCACTGCLYSGVLESGKCQMKATVLELVRTKGIPKYEILGKADGTTEYHIIGNYINGCHRNKEKMYAKYKQYLDDDVLDIVEDIDISLTNKIIAALFISGKSRDEVCNITHKSRENVNSMLSTIYVQTQDEVNYKTKHDKLGEFIKYFRDELNLGEP